MKKIAAVAVLTSALLLTGCGMTVKERVAVMQSCAKIGGTYTEEQIGSSIYGKCYNNVSR